jgi:hypothetical protein
VFIYKLTAFKTFSKFKVLFREIDYGNWDKSKIKYNSYQLISQLITIWDNNWKVLKKVLKKVSILLVSVWNICIKWMNTETIIRRVTKMREKNKIAFIVIIEWPYISWITMRFTIDMI